MKMNKDKLLKFKGGRRLSIIFLFLFLSSVFCPLSSVTADQIRIRTIITPVGSQSEKWGAKGLMVCIGGETISNGGCGFGISTGVDANGDPVDFEADDVVIFEDDNPENHQYDDGDTIYAVNKIGGGDYVQGGFYGLCKYGIRLYCDPKYNYSYCDTATDTSAGATPFDPVSPATCNCITRECECPSGFSRHVIYYQYYSGHGCGHGAWWKRITCIKD
ncbi:MAG: hypothetical protein KAS87_04995 [Candidatus Omnitrophica bacterium]|nr:hypothetical protein [Candidatus Omnitrophota bacterium]